MNNSIFERLKPLDNETPNAYQAFCDYVGMGHTRSISKLAANYQTRTEAVPTRQTSTLKLWSTKHEWQRRVNEYQAECAIQSEQIRLEAYSAHMEKVLPLADHLLDILSQTINDFQYLRVTRRQIVDDPRDLHLPKDQRRQIERIQTKVNVSDLQTLVAAYGTLNKDLRTALGLPAVTEFMGIEPTVMKTYVGVSPDDWDDEVTPEISPDLSAKL